MPEAGRFLVFIGIGLQYSLLIFLLFFIYKLISYIKADSLPIRREVFSEVEIKVEEAVLIVIESLDTAMLGRRFAFADKITIGRATDNDITISDGYVSHYHAIIALLNNLYYIEDQGSINNTYVNGKVLKGKQYLQAGDVINIGTVSFKFER